MNEKLLNITELTKKLLSDVDIKGYNEYDFESVQKKIRRLLDETKLNGLSLYDIYKRDSNKPKITKKEFLDYCGYEWYKYLKRKYKEIVSKRCNNNVNNDLNNIKRKIEEKLEKAKELYEYNSTYGDRMEQILKAQEEAYFAEMNKDYVIDDTEKHEEYYLGSELVAKRELKEKIYEYWLMEGLYIIDEEQYLKDYFRIESGEADEPNLMMSDLECRERMSNIKNYLTINKDFIKKELFEVIREDIKKIVNEEIEKRINKNHNKN